MDQAARGATALKAGNYSEAIKHYTSAISIQPSAADYYIKRSTAYQRSSPADLQAALRDAETAVDLAYKRAKRELIAQAQLRRAIALVSLERYADADFVLDIVQKFDEKEKSLSIWKKKVGDKIKAAEASDPDYVKNTLTVKERPEVHVPAGEGTSGQASVTESRSKEAGETIASEKKFVPSQTPVDKIRHEWYQNAENVYFSLLAKGVPKDQASIDITERSISISFPTQASTTYDFSIDPLFASIDASSSTSNILSSKVELVLKKKTPGQKWRTLEGTEPADSVDATDNTTAESETVKRAILGTQTTSGAPSYPTSSRTGPKNWDKLAADLTKKPKKESKEKEGGQDDDDGLGDLEDEGGDPVNAFFKKLYAGADPDTRRAMMKSYQESNGTALSTNWAEVSKAPVETSPPDGMVAKKWGE